jgi:hypothetical protein
MELPIPIINKNFFKNEGQEVFVFVFCGAGA